MKFQLKGTIRSYLSIPQVGLQNVSHLDLPTTTQRVKKYWDAQAEVSPDVAAIEFYCLNHLASVVRANFDADEILPEWAQKVMERYVEVLTEQGQRMWSYMILIIAREARHCSSSSMTAAWAKNFSSEFKSYIKSISDSSAESAVKHICNAAPQMKLGEFVDNVVAIFNKGKWGGGFGGKPWGKIAQTLADMIHGKTSLELMVDSAYSLAHNNGPMFNKGMMYGHYTGEFIKILDIQRSGQIPEACLDGGHLHSVKIPAALKLMVASVQANLPNAFGKNVDWKKVQKDGLYKHGYSKELAAQPKAPPAPLTLDGQKVIEVGELTVMPGVTVMQVKRVHANA